MYLSEGSGALKLRVGDLKRRDYFKGIARLSPQVMEKYGISEGDLLLIIGEEQAVAIAKPFEDENDDPGVIRVDKVTRKNAGVLKGDFVYVEKVEKKCADVVKLSPASYYKAPADEEILREVKQRLIGYPVLDGNEIELGFDVVYIELKVIAVKPRGPAVVCENTEVYLFEEPIAKVSRVTFDDIGGLKDVIEKVREIIELPLTYRKLFKKLGIEPPKGILLYGPPGTGKTLLAKALANEMGAHFIAINGPEIMSKYYGESERKLRDIFERAETIAKRRPVIIFIDEIDSIAPKRDEMTGEVEKRVVAQLLTLMDGLKERGKVIVIGATNRPEALDPALRRPGRFDREIGLPMPNKEARKEILRIHTRNLPLAEDVDLDFLAEITHGYTGADLAALAKEAFIKALKRYLASNDKKVTEEELMKELKITMEDFLKTYREIVPSGLREIHVELSDIGWDDIGGLEDAKRALWENVILPLKNGELFRKYGMKPPKGVLLFGPPGCGKTLLAKAVAKESGANLIAVRGPEILSKWVGETERALREIFKKARLHAPSVILFDEIDSLASIRGLEADVVTSKVVPQLITEIDGLQELEGVAIVATTNRPDLLDPALLRPGRFDRLIYVPPPDFRARLEIFKVHTRNMPLAEDVDLEELARKTEKYTGADIAAICREALMIALRENGYREVKEVRREHFEKALRDVKPSLTEDLIKLYEEWNQKIKQLVLRPRGPPYHA